MAEVVALIPQPHGGALLPGQRPGEPTRGPWGRGGKNGQLALVRALERVLEGEGGVERLAEAMMAVATDKGHPLMVQAAKFMVERLYGPVPQAHLHAHTDTQVERRKVRLVDYEVAEVKAEPPAEPTNDP